MPASGPLSATFTQNGKHNTPTTQNAPSVKGSTPYILPIADSIVQSPM